MPTCIYKTNKHPSLSHRYELPEQHEPLVVLIPEEGAPDRDMTSDGLAREIKGRRADGATATLVFDQALLNVARESGLLLEGAGAEPPPSDRRERQQRPPCVEI